MGGGTILILLLSLFLKLEQNMAQAINLIFFIPTSVMAIIIGIKDKNIIWKESLIIIICGIIGAAIGANISSNINVNILKKAFGIFLLIISIHEIYLWYKTYIKKKIRHNKNK